jgi:hypothetical protein
MLKTILLILISILVTVRSSGQVNDQKTRQLVLEKGIVDSLFIFGKWTKDGETETHLKYLGSVTTKSGQTYKIINSSWFWGHSHRATSRILVFNNRNLYLGNYYLSMVDDLPTTLENGNLIFNNTNEDRDKTSVTAVNLKNGLPKQFFRRGKDKFGDIYSFGSD